MSAKKAAVAEKVENALNGKVVQMPSKDFFVTWDVTKDTDKQFRGEFDNWRGKNPDGSFRDKDNRLFGVMFDRENSGWTVPVYYHERLRSFAESHGFDLSEMPKSVNPRLIGPLSNGDFYLRFPYNTEVQGQLKADVPGSHYDGSIYAWVAPNRSKQQLDQFAEDEGFDFIDYMVAIEDDDDDF